MCPECAHEWSPTAASGSDTTGEDAPRVVKDSVGNVLSDGDSLTVIKGLKVKGAASVLKAGTRVKNIRLVEGDHDIDCRVESIGQMGLKSELVK